MPVPLAGAIWQEFAFLISDEQHSEFAESFRRTFINLFLSCILILNRFFTSKIQTLCYSPVHISYSSQSAVFYGSLWSPLPDCSSNLNVFCYIHIDLTPPPFVHPWATLQEIWIQSRWVEVIFWFLFYFMNLSFLKIINSRTESLTARFGSRPPVLTNFPAFLAPLPAVSAHRWSKYFIIFIIFYFFLHELFN